jgi:hypothetical protein
VVLQRQLGEVCWGLVSGCVRWVVWQQCMDGASARAVVYWKRCVVSDQLTRAAVWYVRHSPPSPAGATKSYGDFTRIIQAGEAGQGA